MKRCSVAPGVFLTEVPGEKFKRCKVSIHLTVPSVRQHATAAAVLPHVLDRRCDAIPDPLALSRRLFSLYGAELTSESYTAGAARVITLGISGLKSEYALNGEDLAAEYLELLCNLLFAPKLAADGAFEADDVAIERDKQADFLRSEMNDKRSYCIRQARRRLYGGSPLGIESPGYLEDIPGITPQGLYAQYLSHLGGASMEVMVCGAGGDKAATLIAERLKSVRRAPAPPPAAPGLPAPAPMGAPYTEPMDTVQGKLCIIAASGRQAGGEADAVMRLGSAIYGGLPTSRLFMNVREKQSLCYYCASSFGYFGGILTVDSGVDHENAGKASAAILHELEQMQQKKVKADELDAAKRYLRSAFSTAKDSPDALMNWAFNEWLRGTNRTLDDTTAMMEAVTAEQVRQAMAGFVPTVEYRITAKEGA